MGDMKEELLNEIKEKIFDHYSQNKKNRELNEDINDTLVSISEVTGLTYEEIKPIADNALQDYKSNKKKVILYRLIFSGFIVAMAIIGSYLFLENNLLKNVQATLFITNHVSPNNEHGDIVKNVTVNEKFSGYVRWQFESIGDEYKAQLKIIDPTGRAARVCTTDMTPTSYSWVWSCSYKFKKGLDKIGNWKFEVYLNKQKLGETFFTVSSH
jgi:hypothetical protein